MYVSGLNFEKKNIENFWRLKKLLGAESFSRLKVSRG
jgi:hypothetical protein